MLDRLGKPSRREVSTLSDRALVLVLNRLIAPAGEPYRLSRRLFGLKSIGGLLRHGSIFSSCGASDKPGAVQGPDLGMLVRGVVVSDGMDQFAGWHGGLGGLPPRDEEVARNGLTIAYSSSVIRPRITADLPRERSASNHAAPRWGNRLVKKEIIGTGAGPSDSFCKAYVRFRFFYCWAGSRFVPGPRQRDPQSSVSPQSLLCYFATLAMRRGFADTWPLAGARVDDDYRPLALVDLDGGRGNYTDQRVVDWSC
jgi:hypothetical protein